MVSFLPLSNVFSAKISQLLNRILNVKTTLHTFVVVLISFVTTLLQISNNFTSVEI